MRWLWALVLSACAHTASSFPMMSRAQAQPGAPAGNVTLSVVPVDAQISVDGVMQGLGSDFDGTHGALNLPPGPHRLLVSHDGYFPETLTLYASDDGRQVVQVNLQKQ